jgi:hypothetical protein
MTSVAKPPRVPRNMTMMPIATNFPIAKARPNDVHGCSKRRYRPRVQSSVVHMSLRTRHVDDHHRRWKATYVSWSRLSDGVGPFAAKTANMQSKAPSTSKMAPLMQSTVVSAIAMAMAYSPSLGRHRLRKPSRTSDRTPAPSSARPSPRASTRERSRLRLSPFRNAPCPYPRSALSSFCLPELTEPFSERLALAFHTLKLFRNVLCDVWRSFGTSTR